ncbi:MAG: tetratricopeptide repeat protein [bacterium]
MSSITLPEESEKKIIRLSPAAELIDPNAYRFYSDAIIYEAAGATYLASESYRKALQFYPDSYEIRCSLAENLFRLQHFDDALTILSTASPEDGRVWELRGINYRALGAIDSAHYCYRMSVEEDPDNISGYSFLVGSYEHRQQFDSLAWAYENLCRIQSSNQMLWYDLGEIYFELNDLKKAENAFKKSIESLNDATNILPVIRLGDLYTVARVYDSAIVYYQKVVDYDKADFLLWRKLAGNQRITGFTDDAIFSYKKSIEQRSDLSNILSFIWLGETYSEAGQLDSAIIPLQLARSMDSINIMILRGLSNVYMREDNADSAIYYAYKELQAAPENIETQRYYGLINYFSDSLNVADSVFSALVINDEQNILYHRYLGRIALRQGDYERGIAEVNKTIVLDEALTENWLDLAYAYRKMNDKISEIEAYERGLKKVTDSSGIDQLMFGLGIAYEQNGDFDKSVKEFKNLIKRNPQYHQAMNYLGYSLADRGKNLDYARDLIERAVTMAPDNAAYLDSYGWVYYRLGEYDKALIHLLKAVELDRDPVIFDHLGDTYQAMGDTSTARVWWEKSIELDPENETVKEKLGR